MRVKRRPDYEVYDAVQWHPGLKLETSPPIIEEDRGFGLDGIVTFGPHSEMVVIDGMWLLLQNGQVMAVIGDKWMREAYEEV